MIDTDPARRRKVSSEPILAGRRPEFCMNLMTNGFTCGFTWNSAG
jgi:hypothetical protein